MNAIMHVQREWLEKRAHETGQTKDLLFFHAIRDDWEAFDSWACKASSAEDTLTRDILASDRDPGLVTQAAARIADSADPALYVCLVKALLQQANYTSALAVAAHLLQRDTTQTLPLNLVGKYLAWRGEPSIALQVLERSLRLNADQRDIQWLCEATARGATVALPVYVRAVPRFEPLGFYVPAYNAEAYLSHTIEALLVMNYPLESILVVDDGSTDATAEIAARYPVETLTFEENRGLSAARNAAFRHGAHRYVGSVDADVCADSDYATQLMLEFENASPGLAGIGGRLIEMFTDTPSDRWRAQHLHQGWYPRRMYFGPAKMGDPPDSDVVQYFFLNGSNNIFRRDAVLAVGGYDEKYRTNFEDCSLCCTLRFQGSHLAFTRAAITRHRRRDTIASVIRTSWNYGRNAREDAGFYKDGMTLLSLLGNGMKVGTESVQRDLKEHDPGLLFLDLLQMTLFPLMELEHGFKAGVLSRDQAAWVQALLLHQVKVWDARFYGRIHEAVLAESRPLLVAPQPAENPLTEEMRLCVEVVLLKLDEALNTLPDWFIRDFSQRETANEHA